MLQILIDLVSNRVLISTIFGWFTAQLIKILIEIAKGEFSKERLKGAGGMPSTHSSTVCSMLASTFLTDGPGSTQFAVVFFVAMIVIYDAMGVRYTTGRQSKILNEMRSRDIESGNDPVYDKPLDEKMGHTLPEIIVGALIGLVTGSVCCVVMNAIW